MVTSRLPASTPLTLSAPYGGGAQRRRERGRGAGDDFDPAPIAHWWHNRVAGTLDRLEAGSMSEAKQALAGVVLVAITSMGGLALAEEQRIALVIGNSARGSSLLTAPGSP